VGCPLGPGTLGGRMGAWMGLEDDGGREIWDVAEPTRSKLLASAHVCRIRAASAGPTSGSAVPGWLGRAQDVDWRPGSCLAARCGSAVPELSGDRGGSLCWPAPSEWPPGLLDESNTGPAASGVGLPASSRMRCIVRPDKHLGAQVRPSNISLRVAEPEVCQSA
jgi:hypothetical protein